MWSRIKHGLDDFVGYSSERPPLQIKRKKVTVIVDTEGKEVYIFKQRKIADDYILVLGMGVIISLWAMFFLIF